MNELEALLSDLEQLYQGSVREMELRSQRGATVPAAVGHQAQTIRSPQMHYATASLGDASQARKVEPPPRPQKNPYAHLEPQPQPHPQQVAPHHLQSALDRQKEALIRQQQELIQEQSRQIEQLKQLQLQQNQEVPRPMSPGRSTRAMDNELDAIMDDLSHLIAADTKALPDTILDDLQNLELRPSVTTLQPQRRPMSPPLPVVAPMGAVATRARPMSSHYPRASAITTSPPAVQSGYGVAPAIGASPGRASPGTARTARSSVHELHQRLDARPQQLPATLIPSAAPPAQQQKAGQTTSSSSSSSSSSSTGPVPFSARRPTFSAARSRAPLPALYTSVKNGQYDAPPTKTPLVPREVKAHEGALLSLTMGLVDGSTKKIIVSDNFTIQDVLIAYASKLGLWQVDFFSLAESRHGNSDRWLHPAVKVGRYGIQETSKLVLKIKFFKRPRYLVDPVALRLFYLQIQTNVVAGAYPCTERLAIILAAHQLQIQEGDHQPQKHKPGWFGGVDNLQKFVPPEVTLKYPVDYIEERIFRLHAKLIGKTNHEELFREYIDLAAAIPTFGINLYNVFDGEFEKGGMKRRLGIGEDGIMLTRRAEKGAYDFYPWTSMGGWLKASDTVFQVRVVGQPIFAFHAPADCVFDILELMTGYYLMAFHSDPTVPDFPIPYEPDCLPHPRLFLPYKPRNLQNAYTRSCLEIFKQTYEAVCKEYAVRPVEAFMLQMDETLDQSGGVLTKIVLQHCDMGEFQFKALLKGLEAAAAQAVHAHNNILIQELNLSSNQNAITARHAQYIAQLLGACPVLWVLNLNDCRLGTQGAVDIAAALTSNLTLHELHIASNQINDRGMAALVKALKGNQALHTFNFADNGLSADGAKLLGDMLEKNPHVTTLALGVNKFGDLGINHLYHGIKCNTTLLRLDLCRTEFTAKAGKHLLRILTEKPNITCVRLAHNDIGQTGGQMLGAYLTSGSRLTVLDLSYTNIGSKALKAIGRGLRENRSVTSLKLSGNEFDKKGAMALAEALEVNRTLQHLALARCGLPKPALWALVQALRSRNTTLQRLNLSHNPMNIEVAKVMGDVLAYNTSLQTLNLTGCLSSDGAKEIVTGIGVNRALVKLNLSGCRMTKVVWTSLADAILQNRTLEQLLCKDTACDARLFEEVLNHWDLRKHLLHVRVLHLGANNITPTDRLQERIRNYPVTILFS